MPHRFPLTVLKRGLQFIIMILNSAVTDPKPSCECATMMAPPAAAVSPEFMAPTTK